MRIKSRWRWALLSCLLMIGIGGAAALHLRGAHLGKPFGRALTFKPQGQVRGVALVLDERVSRDRPSYRVASELARRGVLVALLPVQEYLAGLGDGQCRQIANDAERVGRRLMRLSGASRYFEPVLVGMGDAGAALAGAAVSHALPQTVGGAVLVGAGAGKAGSACVAGAPVPEQGFLIRSSETAGEVAAVDAVLAHLPKAEASFRGLPLIELPAAGSRRLVIFISGDGGWRALDKGVSMGLRNQGVSVVGWDSLRYFWSQRTPQQTAADLAAVIDEYSLRWHADQVELVGYSFGADAMPFLYNRLPPATKAKVRSLALLGLGHGAAFKVSVGSWLGSSSDDVPVAPEVARVPPGKVLCVFGRKEQDTLCPSLATAGVTVARTSGGHHFDGDIPAMVRRLQDHFQRNGQEEAGAPSARPLPVRR